MIAGNQRLFVVDFSTGSVTIRSEESFFIYLFQYKYFLVNIVVPELWGINVPES